MYNFTNLIRNKYNLYVNNINFKKPKEEDLCHNKT